MTTLDTHPDSITTDPRPDTPPVSMRRSRRLRIAGVGAVILLAATAAAVYRDIRRIDPTRGGYEAPYIDYTGTPIDWWSQQHTGTGFRSSGGWIVDSSLDCTSGMIRLHIGPLTFDYRTLSERAIVIHQPQIPCRERGFVPRWDASGSVDG